MELDPLPVDAGLPRVAPALRIENLLDEQYEEIVNFPERGRTVFVGIRTAIGG